MNNIDDLLEEIDDIYSDVDKKPKPDISETIDDTEKVVDLQIKLAEKIQDLRERQQKREVAMGKEVLNFISEAKKMALQEQSEFQQQMSEIVTAQDGKSRAQLLSEVRGETKP